MLVQLVYYFEVCVEHCNGSLSVEGSKSDDYLLGFNTFKFIIPINLHIRNTLNGIHPIPKFKGFKSLFINSFILFQRWQLIDKQCTWITTRDKHFFMSV